MQTWQRILSLPEAQHQWQGHSTIRQHCCYLLTRHQTGRIPVIYPPPPARPLPPATRTHTSNNLRVSLPNTSISLLFTRRPTQSVSYLAEQDGNSPNTLAYSQSHASLFTIHASLFTVHISLFTVHASLFTVHPQMRALFYFSSVSVEHHVNSRKRAITDVQCPCYLHDISHHSCR